MWRSPGACARFHTIDASRVVDDDGAILLHASRSELHDALRRPRARFALVDDVADRIERVAFEERIGQPDLVPAEGEAVLAGIGDSEPATIAIVNALFTSGFLKSLNEA
jgi:hypothetical protein